MKIIFDRENFLESAIPIMIALCLLGPRAIVFGEESPPDMKRVYLKNGDRITGVVSFIGTDEVIVRNDLLGEIRIFSSHVLKVEAISSEAPAKAAKADPREWKAEVDAGFAMVEGNTVKTSITGGVLAERKRKGDETTLKGRGNYGTENRDTDTQKWYGMARWAYSFYSGKWYHFSKMEADHDRFANIAYRLTPSTGIGH